jgi:hypothetical protein
MKWMKGFLPSMQWPFRETGSRDVRATDRSEPSDAEKLCRIDVDSLGDGAGGLYGRETPGP